MRLPRKAFLYALYVILVLLIASALFVAFKPNKKAPGVATPAQGIGEPAKDKAKGGLSVTEGSSGRLGTTANPNNVSAPSGSTGTSSTSTTTPNAPSKQPAGKTAPTSLANTGPSETLAVFAASSAIGFVAYRRQLIKKAI
ncbi:MAG: hypothetical protein WCF91_01065 [bacterium]